MAKTIFEHMGGTHTMQGDYCLPDLRLPTEEERPLGVWAHRRLRYLKQHHKTLYYNLLTSGKLQSRLADVEEKAQTIHRERGCHRTAESGESNGVDKKDK